jgi:opacity protein-like surface antigen
MKKYLLLLLLILVTFRVYPQFEQKVSLNFSLGGFKTFGKAMGEYDPMQMPHYKPGISAGAGLQYNLNRHFSVNVDISVMYSASWYYNPTGDNNYLHYTIVIDTITNEIVAEGENKLNLLNLSIGVVPKFYLFAVKKWNPYLFAGINLNFTHATYTNNLWNDMESLGLNQPGDSPYNPYLEKNTGIGFLPGIGLDFNPSEKFSFFLEGGYSLILMKDENFKSPYAVENINAVIFRTGIRFSFLKSKNL